MKATVKKRQVVTNGDGEPVGVFLPIAEYNALLDELEELEDIKEYDRIKALNEPAIPLREAIAQRKKSNA